MAGQITVTSTTDTQQAVEAAANRGQQPAQAEAEGARISEADQAETDAESETAEAEGKNEEEEEEEAETEPEEQQHPGRARKKLLRQVSRLTGRNYRLQEQLDEVSEKLRKLEVGERPPAAAPAAGFKAKPVPKDYKDYEQYVEALADWKVEEREVLKAQADAQAYVQQVYEEYNAQVEEARSSHEDFDDVVGQSAAVPMVAINVMYELPNGAEVAYYLGKHPEVRQQLLEWNQPGTKGGIRQIIVELDRISSKLNGKRTSSPSEAENPPRHKSASPPPAPIRPVGGSSASRSTAPPGEMPFSDYKRWYAKHYPGSR